MNQWLETQDSVLVLLSEGIMIKLVEPVEPSRGGYAITLTPNPIAFHGMPPLIILFENESVRNGVYQEIRRQIEEGAHLIKWPGYLFGEVPPAEPLGARDEAGFETSRTPFPGFDKGEVE